MDKTKSSLDSFLRTLCIILFAFLVLLVTWQVITRFVFNAPSSFSEELAKYIFVWLALFGGAFVFGEKGHMAIEFIKDKFSEKIRYATEWFIEVITIVFATLVMIVGGIQLIMMTWSQTSASLGVPVGLLYFAVPLSGLFIVLYCVHHLYQLIKNNPQHR